MESTEPKVPTHQAPAGEGATVTDAAARGEIEAFFDRVARSTVQPRLRRLTGVCQFNIEGAGTWQIELKRGAASVTRGAERNAPPPNCVVSTTARNMVRILHHEGNLNIVAAVLQELVTVTGDVAFAWSVVGSFTMKPDSPTDSLH
jgi:hypothetical protein